MRGSGPIATRPALSPAGKTVLLWLAVPLMAVVSGGVAAQLPTNYVIALLALAVVVAAFLWRAGDPFVPFLLLVAAMQGGMLLQLPMGGAGPFQTLTPMFGGWTVIAVIAGSRPVAPPMDVTSAGRWMAPSLIALAAVVAVTASAQAWRPGGRILSLTEALTLIQLGILVMISACLLTTPRRVMAVAWVTIATGIATSLLALTVTAGLISIAGETITSEGATRASGLIGDPNMFSFQLLVSLAFALHLALAARTRAQKAFCWVASTILVGGIVSSYSAGALVGVVAIIATVLVLQLRVSPKRALLALVAVVVIAGTVALLAPPGYTEAVAEKYSSIPSTSFERLGTRRGAAWEAGVLQIAGNPIIGVGLSTFNTDTAIATHYPLYWASNISAHNSYIGIAVGSGLAGLAAYLIALASAFSILWSSYSRALLAQNREATIAIGCITAALLVASVQMLQLDRELDKYIWLLLGATLAIRRWNIEPGPAVT